MKFPQPIALALAVVCSASQPGLARTETAGPSLAVTASLQPTQVEAAGGYSLSGQISALIAQRLAVVNEVTPQPAADCTDPAAVARRLAALREFDTYVRLTVDGLINAAPGAELRRAMGEEFAAVLELHEDTVTAALVDLLEMPLVRGQGQGWFVISQFGADADRNGGILARTAAADPAFKARVLAKLHELEPHGETSAAVIDLVTEAMGAR